jgi:hypothetical protein
MRNILGSSGLPKPERARGQQHTGKAENEVKALKSLLCKTRVIWQRLDCLKSNPKWPPKDPSPQRLRAMLTRVRCGNDAPDNLIGLGDERRVRLRDEWTAYVTLVRNNTVNHEIAYGTRVLGQQSLHSSPRTGKPSTWRRETGNSTPRLQRYARCETPKQF